MVSPYLLGGEFGIKARIGLYGVERITFALFFSHHFRDIKPSLIEPKVLVRITWSNFS